MLAVWRQQGSILAHRWGVLDFEAEETERPQFRGTYIETDSNNNTTTNGGIGNGNGNNNNGNGSSGSHEVEQRKAYPLWRRLLRYAVSLPVVRICKCIYHNYISTNVSTILLPLSSIHLLSIYLHIFYLSTYLLSIYLYIYQCILSINASYLISVYLCISVLCGR